MTLRIGPDKTEPLGLPGTARQLAAGITSANTALSETQESMEFLK